MDFPFSFDTYLHKLNSKYPLNLSHIPKLLQSSVEGLLQIHPESRQSVQQLLDSSFFQTGPISTLKTLESILEQNYQTQINILMELPTYLQPFPINILNGSVLPIIKEVKH